MPFKSKAQRRKFYTMANRGEISEKTVKHWEDATHGKKLPEHVKKAFDAIALPPTPTVPSPAPLSPVVAVAAAPTIAKLKAQAVYKLSSVEHDQISGGKADHKSDKDFDPEQLAKGLKVEREHTSDPAKALEITEDHLTEFDRYYTALDKMEKKLKEGKTAAYCIGVHAARCTIAH